MIDGPPPAGGHSRTLRALAHDLGNLAYRLTFLSENLKRQIADPEERDEAAAMIDDTVAKLRAGIETLREIAPHV